MCIIVDHSDINYLMYSQFHSLQLPDVFHRPNIPVPSTEDVVDQREDDDGTIPQDSPVHFSHPRPWLDREETENP
jgi:hypothetical protein